MTKSFCGLDDNLHQELMDRYENKKSEVITQEQEKEFIMTMEQNEEVDIYDDEGNQIGTYEKSVCRDNEFDRPSYNDLY